MKTIIVLLAALLPVQMFAQQIHSTAQCESVKSNVLGIKDLKDCTIGVVNYGNAQVFVTQAQFREWYPSLQIENAARAQAVGDKAFNSSKKSKAIAALNFLSPLAVAFMGGGLIHATVEAVAAVSLANTAAQSFKAYLIGQQPDEAAFLPTCQNGMTLAPYGTPGFSQECTVLGSIDFTTSSVIQPGTPAARNMRFAIPSSKGGTLVWQGDLPTPPVTHAALEIDPAGTPVAWEGRYRDSLGTTLPESAKTPAPLDESDRASGEFVALVALNTMR